MKAFLAPTLAALVAAGATYAFAQSPAAPSGDSRLDRMEQRMERMERMENTDRWERRGERMQRRFDARIQRMKTELKLTAAQEPLFDAVEQQFRKMTETRRAERQANMQRFRNAELPDRLDLMSERAARNATTMRELSTTVKPLWAILTVEQKEIVRKNMPGRGMSGGRWHGEGRRG